MSERNLSPIRQLVDGAVADSEKISRWEKPVPGLLPALRAKAAALRREVLELEWRLEDIRIGSSARTNTALEAEAEAAVAESPPPEQASPSLRVKLPWPRAQASPRLSATFTLDWDFSAIHSQDELHPQSEDGARTLLARAVEGDAGSALYGALRAVQSLGLLIDDSSLADGVGGGFVAYGVAADGTSRALLKAHALGGEGAVSSLSLPPWLSIYCLPSMDDDLETRLITTLVEGGVTSTRATTLPHSSEEIGPFSIESMPTRELSLRIVTGGAPPTTLFTLHTDAPGAPQGSNGLIVAKALCGYHNTERLLAGPTLHLLEVAHEWTGRGLGTELLQSVEAFFGMLCRPIADGGGFSGLPFAKPSDPTMRLMATAVTGDSAACRWFLRRGFSDDDGAGEELSKALEVHPAGPDDVLTSGD